MGRSDFAMCISLNRMSAKKGSPQKGSVTQPKVTFRINMMQSEKEKEKQKQKPRQGLKGRPLKNRRQFLFAA